MLRAYFQHRRDDAAILAANERLERQVADRTASLRRLAAEVCLAEERERRRIAADLHDHLGQALALMKMRLQNLRGDAVLGGHGSTLDELVALSDQAIRYTRSLTFDLSPPVLYELGLGPALEWLGEDLARRHGLKVAVRDRARLALPDDLKVMLWKSARELLHNVVKHAARPEGGHRTGGRRRRRGGDRGRRRPRFRRRAAPAATPASASASSPSRNACTSWAAAWNWTPRPGAGPPSA